MTRLILTTSDSGAGNLRQSGIADIVIPLGFQFIWEAIAVRRRPRLSGVPVLLRHSGQSAHAD